MSVVRKSANGKSVSFIDDYGNVYITSKSYLIKYLYSDSVKFQPLLLTRLSNKVGANRFKLSPLWVDGEKVDMTSPPDMDLQSMSEDSLSKGSLKKGKEDKIYSMDIVV